MAEKTELKEHEIRALEVNIRRHVKHSGGFRKGTVPADKKATHKLLKLAGRKEVEWNHSIDLGMRNEKTAIRAKTSKNSID